MASIGNTNDNVPSQISYLGGKCTEGGRNPPNQHLLNRISRGLKIPLQAQVNEQSTYWPIRSGYRSRIFERGVANLRYENTNTLGDVKIKVKSMEFSRCYTPLMSAAVGPASIFDMLQIGGR